MAWKSTIFHRIFCGPGGPRSLNRALFSRIRGGPGHPSSLSRAFFAEFAEVDATPACTFCNLFMFLLFVCSFLDDFSSCFGPQFLAFFCLAKKNSPAAREVQQALSWNKTVVYGFSATFLWERGARAARKAHNRVAGTKFFLYCMGGCYLFFTPPPPRDFRPQPRPHSPPRPPASLNRTTYDTRRPIPPGAPRIPPVIASAPADFLCWSRQIPPCS